LTPDSQPGSERVGKTGVDPKRTCYVAFQLAEVAVPRNLFREILRRIDEF
jgi:hypothetical protein